MSTAPISKAAQHQTAVATSTSLTKISPTFMISGHIDISWQLFLSKYAVLLERAIHGFLPANFEPEMPNEDQNNKGSATPKVSLPPFDLSVFAPFLQDQQHPIFSLAPDARTPHTIKTAISAIPPKDKSDFFTASQSSLVADDEKVATSSTKKKSQQQKEQDNQFPPTCVYFPAASSGFSSSAISSFLSLASTSASPCSSVLYEPHFVMGDADGADFFSQVYLIARGFGGNMSIYHRGSSPRSLAFNPKSNPQSIKIFGNFHDHTKKDAAMTNASSVDIAWVRTVDEQRQLYGEKFRFRLSGTEKNILRRRKITRAAADGNGAAVASAPVTTSNNAAQSKPNNNNNKKKGGRLQ